MTEAEQNKLKSEKVKIDAEIELMHEKFKLEKEKLYWGFIVALVGTLIGVYTANKNFDTQLQTKEKELALKREEMKIKKLELCLQDKTLHWCKK